MLLDKSKLIEREWKGVEGYLKKDSSDGIKLAIIESENIFLKVVNDKGYKAKKPEDKINLAIQEAKRPEVFLKTREQALKIKNDPGSDISDPYSGQEIVDIYKESIEEILFGVIDEKRMQSFKYRFWDLYHVFFSHRKSVYKTLGVILLVIAIMLFIADTALGKYVFDFLIEKIHLILRIVLFVVFIVFLFVFFVTFSVILWEGRLKKRIDRKK